MDRYYQVWGLGAQQPHFSLEGHDRGVNCLDYYPGGEVLFVLTSIDSLFHRG